MRHSAFSHTDHRPWPLPDRPWVMQQQWLDLLFLHWEIDVTALRPLIPTNLEIDTFDGRAWIGVVPFFMRGVRPRGLLVPSSVSAFPEINVRTYVVRDGKPGVWFFSLDVPNRLPVWVARTFFHLPYFKARMEVRNDRNGTHYKSRYGSRSIELTYRGAAFYNAPQGSFERWATERYCLYSARADGCVYRGEIQHPPWPLQLAEYDIIENSMLSEFPIGSRHPSVLFSKHLPVVAWRIQKC